MRSHEERIAEVKRRIAEKERRRRQQQERIAAVGGVPCGNRWGFPFYARYGQSNGAEYILRLWNSGNNAGRQCCAWIYRDRTARLCPWCVCDNRVLPYLPAA